MKKQTPPPIRPSEDKNVLDVIREEMITDDDNGDKESSYLERAYNNHPHATDQVLIAICGWSYESLVNMLHGINPN